MTAGTRLAGIARATLLLRGLPCCYKDRALPLIQRKRELEARARHLPGGVAPVGMVASRPYLFRGTEVKDGLPAPLRRPSMPQQGRLWGMKSGSYRQGRTTVVGFESGPWLLLIGDVGF